MPKDYGDNESIRIRCILIEEREKAVQVRPMGTHKEVWLPRSQLEHISKEAPDKDGWRECVITMPLWLAEEKKLT